MGKILKVLVVVIIAVILVFYFSINSIIKGGVEAVGPQVLGTDVKLDKASISMFSGKGELKGIMIGNPKGFKTESAFKLAQVRVDMDVQSLLSDTIIIKEIFIDAPEVTYEKGLGSDNVQSILKNIEKFTGPSKETKEEKKTDPEKEGKKLQINNLIIKNGKVNMSVTALQGEQIELPLADIHLKDIGKEGDSSISDVMGEVFAAVNKNVLGAVAGSAKVVAEKAEKMAKDAAEKAVGEKAGEAVDAIKGIFGK